MLQLPERFMEKVKKQPNGCWHWTGPLYSGYGRFADGSMRDGTRRTIGAHRYAHERVNGPLPAAKRGQPGHLHVDHMCHNASETCAGGDSCEHRRCVNPAHLRAVPARVNILAGKGPVPRNHRAERCIHGHAFTPDNTYVAADGHRTCRRCAIDNSRSNKRVKAATKPREPHYQTVKTHCPYGHPYSGENLRARSDGGRACKTCQRRRVQEHRERVMGRPGIGHQRDRTHCIHGHPLSGDNLYVAPSTGKRSCRTCRAENGKKRHAALHAPLGSRRV